MKKTLEQKIDSRLLCREANSGDVASLVQLINSAYRGEESRQGWTTEADFLDGKRIEEAGILEILAAADSTMLVFFDRDNTSAQPVGAVYLKKMAEKSYLGMLTVKPDRQGCGFGKIILQHSEAFVRSNWSSPSIEMTVISQRSELLAFYERCGYEITGETRPFPYHELKPGEAKRFDLEFNVLEKKIYD